MRSNFEQGASMKNEVPTIKELIETVIDRLKYRGIKDKEDLKIVGLSMKAAWTLGKVTAAKELKAILIEKELPEKDNGQRRSK